jgi:nucleoside-diphosphate-sugar epimerase
MSGHVLLTGFPANELACRVLLRLVQTEADTQVVCLVMRPFMDAAEAWLEHSLGAQRSRVQLLEGEVASIDFGLSGQEYRELAESVERIHHCAAITYSGAPASLAERVNVGGAYEVLEFAREAKRLQRVVHWSTLLASAPDASGLVREDTLEEPRSTKLLHTRYRAERAMVRARHELPITVLRPAPLVGDTAEGALRRLEGLHLLIAGFLSAPRELPLPLLGPREAPLYAVPIDYAVDAGLAIARARDTVGGTYHIIERSAPLVHEVFAALSELLGRPPPRGQLPAGVARALFQLPGLGRLAHGPQALIEELVRGARADDTLARPVLTRAGLEAPSLLAHLPKIVEYVSRQTRRAYPPLTLTRTAS